MVGLKTHDSSCYTFSLLKFILCSGLCRGLVRWSVPSWVISVSFIADRAPISSFSVTRLPRSSSYPWCLRTSAESSHGPSLPGVLRAVPHFLSTSCGTVFALHHLQPLGAGAGKAGHIPRAHPRPAAHSLEPPSCRSLFELASTVPSPKGTLSFLR